MTVTLSQAQRFAQLKKTKVINGAFKIEGETITFVMESGPKLSMTSDELNTEIATMEKAIAREQAILAIDSEPKPKKAAAEPKPKTKDAAS